MTAGAARSTRARRGRIMIVGEIPELAHLVGPNQRGSGGPLVARNLYDAMGEVTVASATAPITSLVLLARSLPAHAGHAIEAIRKIDPALRIVVIAPPASITAGEWLNKGVDECVATPIAPADISRIFDDEAFAPLSPERLLSPSPPPPEDRAAPSPEPPEVRPAKPVDTAAPLSLEELRDKLAAETRRAEPSGVSAGPRGGSGAKPPLIIDIGAETAEQPIPKLPLVGLAPPPIILDEPLTPQRIESLTTPSEFPNRAAPPANLTKDLGDTDLVEAILSQDGSLKRIALQLIAQQTGWLDLAIADAPPQQTQSTPLDTLASAPLTFESKPFGHLTSTTATAAQLAPWADWLARWLALDQRHRDSQTEALTDPLTGAFNRRFFERFLTQAIADAALARRPLTVMVFDIDNFKPYNDAFGHEAGDDILCEIVRLMKSVIRQGDRVCRIGGDEFAVIFADPSPPRKPSAAGSSGASGGGSSGGGKIPGAGAGGHPESIEVMTKRFQDQVCSMRFPKLGEQAPGSLSISAGLAAFPWDGHDPQTLLRHADQLALESKRKGKNAITFGPGAKRVCGNTER